MSFRSLLDGFRGRSILVVGDVMLDEYIFGKATRISPEAPVMVVRHSRSETVPGGAANVAKNVASFEARATLIGIVGADEGGAELAAALDREGIAHTLVSEEGRATTRKTRVVADLRHQVLRIDREDETPVGETTEARLLDAFEAAVEECDGVILSDYRKGCLTRPVAEAAVARCRALGKPVVVNPKPSSLEFYRGATAVSLNRLEASEALGQQVDEGNAEGASRLLREALGVEWLVVTLGDAGMAVSGPEAFRIEAPKVEVADPAGAGDTVVAAVALGLASGGAARETFELAAAAASFVVRHVGVATVSAADLAALRG